MASDGKLSHLWENQTKRGIIIRDRRKLSRDERLLIGAAIDHYLERLRVNGVASEAEYVSKLPERLRERALSLLHTTLLLAKIGKEQD